MKDAGPGPSCTGWSQRIEPVAESEMMTGEDLNEENLYKPDATVPL